MKKVSLTQADHIFTTPGYERPHSKNNKTQSFKKGNHNEPSTWIERYPVEIQAGPVGLNGMMNVPARPIGLVVFIDSVSHAHALSERMAARLNSAGLATLLFGMLTAEEEEQDVLTANLSVDVSLMARRAIGTLDWLSQQPIAKDLKFGCFGTGSGAAGALIAAIERPKLNAAVVVRGGRPDLIYSTLPRVRVPVLLLVDEIDQALHTSKMQALSKVDGSQSPQIRLIPGAAPLFGEPEACEEVAVNTRDWFQKYLGLIGNPTRG